MYRDKQDETVPLEYNTHSHEGHEDTYQLPAPGSHPEKDEEKDREETYLAGN